MRIWFLFCLLLLGYLKQTTKNAALLLSSFVDRLLVENIQNSLLTSRHLSSQLDSCQTPRTLGSSDLGVQAVLRTRFGGGSRQRDERSFRSSTPLPYPPTHCARCRAHLSGLHWCRYQRTRKFRCHHAAWRLPGSLPFASLFTLCVFSNVVDLGLCLCY